MKAKVFSRSGSGCHDFALHDDVVVATGGGVVLREALYGDEGELYGFPLQRSILWLHEQRVRISDPFWRGRIRAHLNGDAKGARALYDEVADITVLSTGGSAGNQLQ